MTPEEVRRRTAGAVVVEVGWRTPEGTVRAAARTPLLYDPEAAGPTLALTYDDAGLAAELSAAESVVLIVSDARLVLRDWEPIAWRGRAHVDPDPEGDAFLYEMVDQELRKHPPTRMRADSLLQRRENWWYVARLLVRFTGLDPIGAPAARNEPDQGVLVWNGEQELRVDTVAVDDWSADRMRLRALGGHGPQERTGPAALLRHDYSDDFDRRAHLLVTGRIDHDTLEVAGREGNAQLPPVPSWWQRLRSARRLERQCTRAISAAGH